MNAKYPIKNQVSICGVHIDNLTMGEVLLKIDTLVQKGKPSYIVTPNADHIIKIQNDKFFKKIYEKATMRVVDGVPLIWASRFLGVPLKERINGTDLLEKVCDLANKKKYRLFFLGGNPGDAESAASIIRRKYPDIPSISYYCPKFNFEKSKKQNEYISNVIKKEKGFEKRD